MSTLLTNVKTTKGKMLEHAIWNMKQQTTQSTQDMWSTVTAPAFIKLGTKEFCVCVLVWLIIQGAAHFAPSRLQNGNKFVLI